MAQAEYFEEKRKFEDLWKAAAPVGIESPDLLYKHNWCFTNLEKAFEEGGDLHGNRVYLFSSSEPQLLQHPDGAMRMTHVPAVVAVVCPFPPSDEIARTSVQSAYEEISHMRKYKMDWFPYVPRVDRECRAAERIKPDIFVVGWTMRESALKRLKQEDCAKFTYCLPYFDNPFNEDAPVAQKTTLSIEYEWGEKQKLECDFNYEYHELENFTQELILDGKLPSEQEKDFKKLVEKEVGEKKAANEKARVDQRADRKRKLEKMSEETKAGFENIRFYKFYPVNTPDTPVVTHKSGYINRYYGKAHRVF